MFKLNNIEWNVLLVSPFHYSLQLSDGSFALGSCVKNNFTIYINEELSLGKMKKVLCHEITHAAMFSYNIKLTLEQEELLADLIATYGQEVIEVTNKIFNRIKKKRGSY